MVTAAIVINQTGKPAGVVSTSRDDLDLGITVTLSNNDDTDVTSWAWEFTSRPPNSFATLSTPFNPTSTFSPDVRGSYLVKLTVSDGTDTDTDQRIAAVKTYFLGIRVPALEETSDFSSIQGWAAAIHNAFLTIDAYSAIALKIDGTNSPTENIDFNDKRITTLHDPVSNYDAATKYYVDTAAAAHDIGGAKHTQSTLTELNSKISDQSIVGSLTSATGDVTGSFDTGFSVVGIGSKLIGASPNDGYVLIYRSGTDTVDWEEAVFDSNKVLVSGTDTTSGYLYDKVSGGLNIQTSVSGIGNEDLVISTSEVIKLPFQLSNPPSSSVDGYLLSKEINGIIELSYLDSQNKEVQITSDGYLATDIGVKNVTLWEQASDPSLLGGNKGIVYTKEALGTTELFYMDNYGVSIQITKDGYLSGASNAAEENLDSTGTETYVELTYTPLSSIYSNSGKDIKVYRNGVLMRWISVASADPNRWVYNDALNRVEFAASGASDWYSVLYNKI